MPASEERFLEWLRAARRVLAFCGAGVSAESGVPTFRGSGGLWEGHRIQEVATPEAFEYDPQKVWRFYAQRQALLPRVEPNPAHHALAAMEEHYDEFLLVTQNVDNLHERAGSGQLIKLHGSLMEVRCTECGRVTPIEAPVSLSEIDADRLPECRCGGLLRPNVVWFGELLKRSHLEAIHSFFVNTPGDCGHETLVLVIGTSGVVSDGYGIPDLARRVGERVVEINPESSELSRDADLIVRAPAGALLGRIWPRVTRRP